ncbi:MAG: hypothetical protein PHI71_04170 [Acidiphilium sp.]|nr:hypothetical protein [Acidiphilium sp.]
MMMMTIGNISGAGAGRCGVPAGLDAHAELLRLCARIGYSPHRS